ncbi:MAG: polymer-forming cytoskeletal protein [Candidatus Eiseniibacteriota bacterium]|jgi:cytoskeletal protein CcmA (bactofilin family)
MFGRSEDRIARNGTTTSQGHLNSILGDSSHMSGTMQVEGSVRIDGEFEGSITASEAIVVGRTGVAHASLQAREILVAGQVRGKLLASERVELEEGAHVEAEVLARSFVIADGVYFNGNCAMRSEGQGDDSDDSDDGRDVDRVDDLDDDRDGDHDAGRIAAGSAARTAGRGAAAASVGQATTRPAIQAVRDEPPVEVGEDLELGMAESAERRG